MTTIGHYEILGVIGDGGMGTVYLGRDLRFGRVVALKVLHPHFRRDPGVVDRFRIEAVIQAKLQHPHVVSVLDFIADAEVLAIVMEHVEGPSVEQVLSRAAGPLAPEWTQRVMCQVLAAMDDAHAHGLVHRDLKPSNILVRFVGDSPFAMVTDFGIAKVLGAEKMRTATGAKMGTLAYMSPEQLRTPRDVDHRADIYALGATLYQMLAGRQPFDGETEYDLMEKILKAPVPSLQSLPVPAAFGDVVARAMAKTASGRFASCGEMGRALAAVRMGDSPPSSEPTAVGWWYPQKNQFSLGPADVLRDVPAPNIEPLGRVGPTPPAFAAASASADVSARRSSGIRLLVGVSSLVVLAIVAAILIPSTVLNKLLERDRPTSTAASTLPESEPQPGGLLPGSSAPRVGTRGEAVPGGRPAAGPTSVVPPPAGPGDAGSPPVVASDRRREADAIKELAAAGRLQDALTRAQALARVPGAERQSAELTAGIQAAIADTERKREAERDAAWDAAGQYLSLGRLDAAVEALGGYLTAGGDRERLLEIAGRYTDGGQFASSVRILELLDRTSPDQIVKARLEIARALVQLEETVSIPGGMVRVGGEQNESYRKAERIRVQQFSIDKYEVTNLQYQRFVRATARRPPAGWTGSEFPAGKALHPVVGVTFDDASAYARWAGKRLPTDEEWDRAAKGDADWNYPWGVAFETSRANVGSTDTEPVTARPQGASPFGVMHMVGNVLELTRNGLARGGSYLTPAIGRALWLSQVQTGKQGGGPEIGFRCAR